MTPHLAVTLAVAAETTTPTAPATDIFSALLVYGPLGIMVIGLVTGHLVPGYLYKRSEAENDRLRALVESKVIPLVEQNSRVTGDALDLIKSFPRSSGGSERHTRRSTEDDETG